MSSTGELFLECCEYTFANQRHLSVELSSWEGSLAGGGEGRANEMNVSIRVRRRKRRTTRGFISLVCLLLPLFCEMSESIVVMSGISRTMLSVDFEVYGVVQGNVRSPATSSVSIN